MCDVCAAIKDARERTLDSNVRNWLTEIMEKHVKLQRYIYILKALPNCSVTD